MTKCEPSRAEQVLINPSSSSSSCSESPTFSIVVQGPIVNQDPRQAKAHQGGPRLGCPELGWAGLGRHLVQWPVKWVICSVALSKTKLWLSPACCCCCCCCFSAAGNAPPKRSKTRWQWQQLWAAAADQTSIQQQTTQAAVWSPTPTVPPTVPLFFPLLCLPQLVHSTIHQRADQDSASILNDQIRSVVRTWKPQNW